MDANKIFDVAMEIFDEIDRADKIEKNNNKYKV